MSVADLTTLIRIQDLDVRLMELSTDLGRLPSEYALEEQAAEQARQAVEAQRQEHEEARREAQRSEGEIKVLEDQIGKLTVQLNTAKTNKEYQLILGQINGAKVDLSRAEEIGLEALSKVEELDEQQREASETLAAREADLEAAKARVAGRRQDLEREIGELRSKRHELTGQVEDSLMDTYERILTSREGQALVRVIDGTCQGCFVRVTAQEMQLLQSGDEFVRCRNCARILVASDLGD
jgi:predicted  nucleic acid-binding Zn-ribbon protein